MRYEAGLISIGAGTLLLLAGTVTAVRAAPADTPNQTDRTFAITVGQGNVAEVQASRLALKKSDNKGVRRVATMLITQHSEAQTALMQAGSRVHVRVPDDTDAAHKAALRKLTRLSGRAFDKAYLKGLVRDHYKTIALFNLELKNGNNSTIHGFAARYLPDIETHTQHITAQASKFGIPTSARADTHRPANSTLASSL